MSLLVTKTKAILAEHAGTRVNGRVAADRTAAARGESILGSMRQLYALGYKLDDPRNIGDRHIKALCTEWHKQGLKAKTIQVYLSNLRIFGGWVGKKGMVKSAVHYLPDVPKEELRVTTTAKVSKSWAEAGINVAEKIELATQLDWRFGLMVMAQLSYGLRRMEVLQMKPWKCDRGDKFAVYKTKGGRPRDIYIDTDAQREVLDFIKSKLKKNEFLGWQERENGRAATLAYSERRYNHLMARLGITREHANVTGHGLRAQYAENAALVKSLIPPTLGGTAGQMPRDESEVVRLGLSESLGHSRISITNPYIGSFGRDYTPDEPDRAMKVINAGMAAITVPALAAIPSDRMLDCMKLSNDLIAAGIYGADVRKVAVLWERHSRRHATEWLKPSEGSNLAALEVAAMSILEMNDPGAAAATE